MLGGCSLGSIFANLCVAAPVSKNVGRARSCCQRWPLNPKRRADKCRWWDVSAWDMYACRAPGNDGRRSRVFWVLM